MSNIVRKDLVHETGKKPGYKKTKLGWIPEEWEVVNLSKIVKRLDAGVSVNSEDTPAVNGEFGILKTSCVYANDFNPKENKTIKPDEISRAKLNPKTERIIISRMNTPELVGACGYVKADYPNLFLPDRLWQTTFMKEFEKSGLWLFYLLNTSMYRYKIQNLASGTSNSMKNISKSSILKLLVPLPPLPEQQKIATILSTWDKAIELTQRLIEAKKEQKKGLMQQLLTGKVRVQGVSGEWGVFKIKEIAGVDINNLSNTTSPNYEFTYISLSDVNKGKLNDTQERIKFEEAPSRARRIVKKEDILLATVRPNLQAFTKISQDIQDYVASTGFAVITTHKWIFNADYLYQYLFSSRFIKQLESLVVGSSYPAIQLSSYPAIQLSSYKFIRCEKFEDFRTSH